MISKQQLKLPELSQNICDDFKKSCEKIAAKFFTIRPIFYVVSKSYLSPSDINCLQKGFEAL